MVGLIIYGGYSAWLCKHILVENIIHQYLHNEKKFCVVDKQREERVLAELVGNGVKFITHNRFEDAVLKKLTQS